MQEQAPNIYDTAENFDEVYFDVRQENQAEATSKKKRKKFFESFKELFGLEHSSQDEPTSESESRWHRADTQQVEPYDLDETTRTEFFMDVAERFRDAGRRLLGVYDREPSQLVEGHALTEQSVDSLSNEARKLAMPQERIVGNFGDQHVAQPISSTDSSGDVVTPHVVHVPEQRANEALTRRLVKRSHTRGFVTGEAVATIRARHKVEKLEKRVKKEVKERKADIERLNTIIQEKLTKIPFVEQRKDYLHAPGLAQAGPRSRETVIHIEAETTATHTIHELKVEQKTIEVPLRQVKREKLSPSPAHTALEVKRANITNERSETLATVRVNPELRSDASFQAFNTAAIAQQGVGTETQTSRHRSVSSVVPLKSLVLKPLQRAQAVVNDQVRSTNGFVALIVLVAILIIIFSV